MSATESTQKKPAFDAAKIDEAIKRAKEQAGEKAAKTTAAKEPKAPKGEKAPKAVKPAKAPKAEKPAKEPKVPAHLNKVERATADLPALSEKAARALKGFDDEGGFTAGELVGIATHLSHKARLLMTASALEARPAEGDRIVILPGDRGTAKYVGMEGVLTKVRSIHCFADVFDPTTGKVIKPGLYCFTSGVKVIAAAAAATPPTTPTAIATEPTSGEFPADPPAAEAASTETATPEASATDATDAPATTEAQPEAATGTEG